MGESTSVFGNRNFRLLWFGETASKFGSTITTLSVPLVAVYLLDAGPFVLGLLEAVAWLPWLLFGLPAGAIIDRMPKRPVLITCDVVSLALLVSVPLAHVLDVLTLPHLMLTAFGVGVSNVFFMTAYQPFLPSIVPETQLQSANSKLQGSESAVQVIGPGSAGLLAQLFSPVIGVAIDAGTFLASLVCIRAIKATEPPVQRKEERSLLRDVASGIKFITGDKILRVTTSFSACFNLAGFVSHAVLVLFLLHNLKQPAGAVGVLLAASGAGGIIGAFVAPWVAKRFGTARGLLICYSLSGPCSLLMAFAQPGWLMVIFVLGGIGAAMFTVSANVIGSTFRQRYVPREYLGRVVSAARMAVYGTIPLGALIGGVLGDRVGVRETMIVSGFAVCAAALILLCSNIRKLRDFPVKAEPVSVAD
ncbi:MFS transporter [Amycolatopsis magusensis]|uniref:MFS family permease n=1 Tax=Amycolatopsis magusensis TaxID=882444 RepID=A0ABS4PWM1_9PSEU|nr:MFS transporter [Amycolatopsis magusensis]MBP2183829.1 MFS family permease [Amycolatopsis magusensis]